MFTKLIRILIAAMMVFGLMGFAQAAPSFYQGKTLTIIVPYGVGGGYDTWARLSAPFMKEYLGVSKVIVMNRHGGGGLIGTNAIYHSKGDGLTIGDTNAAGDVFAQMAKAHGVRFDVTKFSWIGRPDDDPHIIAVHWDSPYKTFDDMIALKGSGKVIHALATGKGSSDYNSAVITYNAFDIPFKMVAAFKGSHAEKATFVAGGGDTISVSASDIAELGAHKARVLALTAAEPFDRLPNIPTVVQLAEKHKLSQDRVGVLKKMAAVMEMGHAFFAPPGVPGDRLEALRSAFNKTLHNKEFLAKAKKAGLYSGYESWTKLEDAVHTAFRDRKQIEPFLKTK